MDEKFAIAAIAASAAAFGTIVAQIGLLALASFHKRHERKAFLRSKHEQLSDQLNESLQWAIQILAEIEAERKPGIDLAAPVPARRVYSLCLIYFRELTPFAEALLTASITFADMVRHIQEEEIPWEHIKNVNDNFNSARMSLDEAISKYAPIYT